MNKEPLLQNLDKMVIKENTTILQKHGHAPYNRPLQEYLKYGVINLDKPCNPSSHEVVTWVKNILEVDKTGHCGTLDPSVSGCLLICLNKATKLVKAQVNKEYICIIQLESKVKFEKFKNAFEFFKGDVLQRPPLMCAVKRNLRIRKIINSELLEFDGDRAIFKVLCEAGTYIRSMCTHIGLLLGVGAYMAELRRVKTGIFDESKCVTLHDIQDAMHVYKSTGNEKYLRKVVMPVECLFVDHKRIVIKDSCIEAICSGAQLTAKGILRYDHGIAPDMEIVLVSTKGEAIATAVSMVTTESLSFSDAYVVCKTNKVIIEKGVYEKQWGNKKEYDIYSD